MDNSQKSGLVIKKIREYFQTGGFMMCAVGNIVTNRCECLRVLEGHDGKPQPGIPYFQSGRVPDPVAHG
jgi:hypothetical protein